MSRKSAHHVVRASAKPETLPWRIPVELQIIVIFLCSFFLSIWLWSPALDAD